MSKHRILFSILFIIAYFPEAHAGKFPKNLQQAVLRLDKDWPDTLKARILRTPDSLLITLIQRNADCKCSEIYLWTGVVRKKTN